MHIGDVEILLNFESKQFEQHLKKK